MLHNFCLWTASPPFPTAVASLQNCLGKDPIVTQTQIGVFLGCQCAGYEAALIDTALQRMECYLGLRSNQS